MESSTQQNLLNQVEENSSNNGTYKNGNGHNQDHLQAELSKKGFTWERLFGSRHPYEDITWETRTAKIVKGDGTVVFEQNNIEVPNFWSQTATDVVASKYFRGRLDASEREYSARQMVDRVAKTIGYWGFKDGYFTSLGDTTNFIHDLTYLLINQYFAFNSPVWFNVGVHARPQVSACQPYRALISTPRGFFKIGDIVENNLVGLPVYDSQGITKVIAVKNNGKKKVFKIILRNGTFIEATGDHLIRAVYEKRTKSIWIRLDRLKKGMRLHLYPHRSILKNDALNPEVLYYKFGMVTADGHLFQQFAPMPPIYAESHINDKLVSEAALAGWIQADGFAGQYKTGTNRSLTLEFLTINDNEKNWIEQHLEVVFPDVHKKIRITKTKLGTPITRIRLYGEKLRQFVDKYDLLKRRDRIRAPEIIWRSKPEVITSYLKSVFQGEGYVSIRKAESYESGRLAIATISENWIHDIQILLYGLGIYSRIKEKREKRSNRQNLYELAIAVGSEKIKFKNVVGFIGNDKIVKLESALGLQDQKNIHDLREEEIVSVEELGIETVYDIQTESGEYLTNNVVVHNCFILAVEDNMQSILNWYRDEGWIFKFGSGAGLNLSNLRSSKEPLSHGGFSSGPISFMKGADGVANSIRSGGTTRRAAKMVVLNVDHPDIKNFIYCKKIIEDMTKILQQAGIKDSVEAGLFDPYTLLPYQNANNSVRVTDDFMRAVEADGYWDLKARTTGKTVETVKAREVMNWITDAAWQSADPGMQYDTTINEWHTLSNTGRINASNPCVTGDTFVATKDGWVRIKNLAGKNPEIGTSKGYKKSSKVWQTGVKETFKLMTKSGYSIKVTEDHKFYVQGEGYIEARNLKRGDRIPLMGSSFGSESLKTSLAFAIGYAVGDGCVSHKVIRGNSALTWVGGEDDYEILGQIANYINMASSSMRIGFGGGLVHVHHSTPGWKVVTSKRSIVDMISSYAILDQESVNKKFTDKIFSLDKYSTASLLRGLFTADGTVSGNKEKGYYVGLDSTSIEMLEQVQLLLLNFEIKSKIYKNRRTQLISYLPDSQRELKAYPVLQMHSLRITRSSRVKFEKEIGFDRSSHKFSKLSLINATNENYLDIMTDEFVDLIPNGVESVYDLTEPTTHQFVANGLLVHNCSEYMSIDNSSCNLASLNLLKFLKPGGEFDVELFKKAVDTTIIAMDVIIDNASFPTEMIEKNTKDYRQLGLGYANLGALLMVMGLPYDSESGRALAGQITSLMCGEAYRMSALVADIKGPFNGYELNKEPMLGVIRKHLGEAEKLRPFVDGLDFDNAELYNSARLVWHDALALGRKYGIRNSQATVLAPTGTISFLMDCDTTGIEPELALIKYKKLVGGGTLKLVNHKVPQALKRLGYNEEQIEAISKHLIDKETIEGAPHLRDEHLPVFDCSFKASNGARSIHYMGHVRMMATAQPFISGAISKTVNLPTEATAEDIKNVFIEGWRLGLKSIAVYRDGSKSIQPLNTKKEEKEKKKDGLVEKSNGYTRIKLPDERPSITHKFSVGGYESYLTVGLYPDTNKPGETFITSAKEGSTVAGLFDTIATLVSMCLQSGMPLKSLVKKFKDMRFEPSGFTNNPQIPIAKSVMDYTFRYIGMKYLNPEDREEIFGPDPLHQNGIEANHSITELIREDQPQKEAVLAVAVSDNDQHKITYQADPRSAGGFGEASAPACANCGTLMFRAGSCYNCPNCFATTGVCN